MARTRSDDTANDTSDPADGSRTAGPKRGKAYTPPKGRPTTHRVGDVQRSRLSPTMEWVVAVIVILLVLGAIMYFFADIGGGGGGHTGAPSAAVVAALTLR